MINIDELYVVNYCHPNCVPLQNIVRLPKKEAFRVAYEIASENVGSTAFGRFADFKNYYPRRIMADKCLYESFVSLGGKPEVRHPLSFVFQGSEFLNNWFDKGTVTKIYLKDIPSEFISFTFGDSCATLEKGEKISVFTKEILLRLINGYEGTIDEYMSEVEKKYHYIEAQLWNDTCVIG